MPNHCGTNRTGPIVECADGVSLGGSHGRRRTGMMERTEQTLTRLRQLITEEGLASDGRIPPERALASELGVGRRSLRRALDVLEKEGRISRHQGRGTFVNTGVNTGVNTDGNHGLGHGSAPLGERDAGLSALLARAAIPA